ncbi:agamous-like MADS-box protein AGL61 [Malania oleifera]|uniref:agamous-like MADS-box protein AGL61 n=1 Tax=Malania oleifera TaxID=397392 RepID=UPI0025AE0FCC|nr:agamous-like MADS-box protein AGL61 [Malania oleifera]
MGNNKMMKGKGRKKIEIKKLPDAEGRLVTFSKRRSGIFKKASELCTLCGVNVSIVTFSPGKKPYAFGHPDVDTIVDRYYLNQNIQTSDHANIGAVIAEALRGDRICALNRELEKLVIDLELEKWRGVKLERMKEEILQERCQGWVGSIDALGMHELGELLVLMETLSKKVGNLVGEKQNEPSTSLQHVLSL